MQNFKCIFLFYVRKFQNTFNLLNEIFNAINLIFKFAIQ
jgi:hypothetical protein